MNNPKLPPIYLGLVHGPVRNKRDEEVTTSVTNLDIHDIARSCKTFGLRQYFIITPIQTQHQLVNRILTHWNSEEGELYNPDRKEALGFIELQNTVAAACETITAREGVKPLVAVTGANFSLYEGNTSALIDRIQIDMVPLLLLFGTGWGLSASIVQAADFRLTPIYGANPDGYNHLSVRSAVAIYLDRMFSSAS